MRGDHARLWTSGGWGELERPAFAYDLTKGALWQRARSQGLIRFGKAPNSSDDDTRPLGLAYRIQWAISPTGNEMLPGVNSAPLVPLGNAFYDQDAVGLERDDHSANQAVAYKGLSVKRNGAWSLWAYVHSPPKGQITKLIQWAVGTAGAGYVFQIRNGGAEMAGLSVDYNDTDMAELRILWGIKEPTQTEENRIDTIKRKIFEDFESLSFENNIGKGDWYGNEFKLSFIPEARGAVHIVLEGLDATSHEVKRIIKTRKEGIVNEASPVSLWSAGGAFFFCLGYPVPLENAKLTFGPFKEGYFTQYLNQVTSQLNASIGEGQTVAVNKVDINSVEFGFEVVITNPLKTWLWITAISTRIAPGPRVPIAETNPFDTDVVYVPANPASFRYDGPVILDIEPSWEGGLTRRSAKVTMMDVLGTLRTAKQSPLNRVGNLQTKDGLPFITKGMVLSPYEVTDVSSLTQGLPIFSSLPNTGLTVTIADGWEILNTTECEPPPIGDGKPFGVHVREYLALAGYSNAEMAGVPQTGKRIARAALGEDWAARVDSGTMIGDALRSLFECYGLGWRFYQDRVGVWQMVPLATTISAIFSSSRIPYPLSEPGRLAILRPIDLSYDTDGFFNHILVIGGEKGEITSEWTDWASVRNPLSPNFIGRRKTKRIVNSGLRTQDDVNYAARSAWYLYGRNGVRATYETYFHDRFLPGQPVEADGGVWEIEGLSGGSWAQDKARFSLIRLGDVPT